MAETDSAWLPIDVAMELAETDCDSERTYPREWAELADRARAFADPNRKAPHFDRRNRPRDDG